MSDMTEKIKISRRCVDSRLKNRVIVINILLCSRRRLVDQTSYLQISYLNHNSKIMLRGRIIKKLNNLHSFK